MKISRLVFLILGIGVLVCFGLVFRDASLLKGSIVESGLTLESTNPLDGVSGVPTNQFLEFTFSDDVDLDFAQANIKNCKNIVQERQEDVPIENVMKVSREDPKTVIIAPDDNLDEYSKYCISFSGIQEEQKIEFFSGPSLEEQRAVYVVTVLQAGEHGDVLDIDGGDCEVSFSDSANEDLDCSDYVASIDTSEADTIALQGDKLSQLSGLLHYKIIPGSGDGEFVFVEKGQASGEELNIAEESGAYSISKNPEDVIELSLQNQNGVSSITQIIVEEAGEDGDILDIDNSDCLVYFSDEKEDDFDCSDGKATINTQTNVSILSQTDALAQIVGLSQYEISDLEAGDESFLMTHTGIPVDGNIEISLINPDDDVLFYKEEYQIRLKAVPVVVGVAGFGAQSVTKVSISTAGENGDVVDIHKGACVISLVEDASVDFDCSDGQASFDADDVSDISDQVEIFSQLTGLSSYEMSASDSSSFLMKHIGDPIDGNVKIAINHPEYDTISREEDDAIRFVIENEVIGEASIGMQSVTRIVIEEAASEGEYIDIHDSDCRVTFEMAENDFDCSDHDANINLTLSSTIEEQGEALSQLMGLSTYTVANMIEDDNTFTLTHVGDPIAGNVLIVRDTPELESILNFESDDIELTAIPLVIGVGKAVSGGTSVSLGNGISSCSDIEIKILDEVSELEATLISLDDESEDEEITFIISEEDSSSRKTVLVVDDSEGSIESCSGEIQFTTPLSYGTEIKILLDGEVVGETEMSLNDITEGSSIVFVEGDDDILGDVDVLDTAIVIETDVTLDGITGYLGSCEFVFVSSEAGETVLQPQAECTEDLSDISSLTFSEDLPLGAEISLIDMSDDGAVLMSGEVYSTSFGNANNDEVGNSESGIENIDPEDAEVSLTGEEISDIETMTMEGVCGEAADGSVVYCRYDGVKSDTDNSKLIFQFRDVKISGVYTQKTIATLKNTGVLDEDLVLDLDSLAFSQDIGESEVRVTDTQTGESFSNEEKETNLSRGDVNQDGVVDVLDAIEIFQFVVKKRTEVSYPENAELTCDETIDVLDALEILKFVVEKESLVDGECEG